MMSALAGFEHLHFAQMVRVRTSIYTVVNALRHMINVTPVCRMLELFE